MDRVLSEASGALHTSVWYHCGSTLKNDDIPHLTGTRRQALRGKAGNRQCESCKKNNHYRSRKPRRKKIHAKEQSIDRRRGASGGTDLCKPSRECTRCHRGTSFKALSHWLVTVLNTTWLQKKELKQKKKAVGD